MGLIFFLFVGLIINFIRYYIGHLSKTKVRKFTQYNDVQETNYGSSSYKVLDLFDKSDSILSIYKKFKNADDDVKLNILRYLELFKSNNDIYSQALALIYKKENLNNFKELENRQISKSVNYKPESKQNSKNINKKKLFFAFYGIIMIFVFLPIIIDDLTENEESVITTDKNTSTTNKRKPTTQDYFYKNVIWKDNYNAQRSKTVKINKSDYYSSVKNRKSISRNSSWRDMANRVIRNDKDKLEELIEMFDNIYSSHPENMSRSYFADIIVSFTQDIPYETIPNAMDIYAPVEFLKKYEGDCDTRTIFLYTLLKKYNYDVVILNSNIYKHSVLGINLPTSGSNYKYYNGRRYYAWETTAKYMTRGLMSSKWSNMNNWFIALK